MTDSTLAGFAAPVNRLCITTQGLPKDNVLWHLMVHVVNHGTQHRSEASILLTSAGHSPGELDLIEFLRERE